MRIILFKTWLTNIGNGFIDKGAKVCLEKAFPEAEIIEVSGFPNLIAAKRGLGLVGFMASTIRKRHGKFRRRFLEFRMKRIEDNPQMNNIINIGELVNADLAVLPGCMLDYNLDIYMKTLKKVRERGIPLIFLGAGGSDYTSETQTWVKGYFKKLSPTALFTRDSEAYKCYSDRFEASYDGIDCGFFISEWFDPPKTEESFIIAAFPSIPEPELNTDYKIIRTNHYSLESPLSGIVGVIRSIILSHRATRRFKNPNILISDCLEDYLFLYSNAKEVHSDKVHACVAAFAYGTPARLYYDTPRAKLFDKVIDEDIRKKIIHVNKDKLEKEKKKQIIKLRSVV